MDSKEQWPTRPVPITWLRGPAWRDGDDVVMDGARAVTYHPFAEPALGLELARVRTPEEAVAFVERFGLLNRPYYSEHERPMTVLREPFGVFQETAGTLRDILETARLVRRGVDGDAEATRALHVRLLVPEDAEVSKVDHKTGEVRTGRAGDLWTPEQRFVGADDRTILMCAHEYHVARPLNDGMWGTASVHDRSYLGESVPPGTLRIGITASTLNSICFLSVALALAERKPVGVCADPACARPFFITDKRQRFCSKACSNRVRFKRFMDKRGKTDHATEGG